MAGDEPFIYVVESPYEDFDDFTRLRACEITLHRSRSAAAWRVDGRSRSLEGQGATARWRRVGIQGVYPEKPPGPHRRRMDIRRRR